MAILNSECYDLPGYSPAVYMVLILLTKIEKKERKKDVSSENSVPYYTFVDYS